MCQWQQHWVSEWVKCYWIKFILNCTESKWMALSVTCVCTESQTTLNFWHHTRSVVPGNFGDQIWTFVKVSWPFPRPKASVANIFDCWFILGCRHTFLVSVHVCAHTVICMFSIEGYFWGLKCVKFWAKFEPASLARCLFCFCKNQILLQNAHARILHWSDYPAVSRAVASFAGAEVEKEIWSL